MPYKPSDHNQVNATLRPGYSVPESFNLYTKILYTDAPPNSVEQGIRLEYAQFGHFDSFDIIRSITSMVGVADADLPTPIATGLKIMYYVDSNVVEGLTYYYKVRVWRGSTSFVSNEIMCIASTPDEHWDKVVVRLTFNTDFTDATGRVWTPTANPQISSSGAFGNCLDLSNGGYLNCEASTDLYLDGDFTIELWMKCTVAAKEQLILASNQRTNWVDGIAGLNYFKDENYVALYNYTGVRLTADNVLPNEWSHVAFSRKNGVLRTFTNGNLSNTYNISGVFPFNKNGTYLGRDAWGADGGYDFRGYIDDFRITKGLGRYTSNFDISKELPTHG